ncbi:MAG: DUF4301 family protein, partial [Alistipes sp.]|nr:DUF4301 family protein [Alistipes sp.]
MTFNEQDLAQIQEHGLTPETVELQVENFKRGFPFLKVVKAASPGDGVVIPTKEEIAEAVAFYDEMSSKLKVEKFVPASGAATRMFKELFEFVNEDKRGKGIDTLLQNLEKFAFWPELKPMLEDGADDKRKVSAIV